MKRTTVLLLVLFACAITTAANEIDFVDTFAEAKQIAGEQDKNLLITFYADW